MVHRVDLVVVVGDGESEFPREPDLVTGERGQDVQLYLNFR